MRVIVASKNPVKVNASQIGFETYFDDVTLESCDVDSGVSDQPMSDAETLKGARKRAKNARKLFPDADFCVGIEGGIEPNDHGLSAFAWVVILGKSSSGESRTTTFSLPPAVAELIAQGYELGHANDMIFKKHNSKQNTGAIGLLTNDKITRTGLYVQAVQLALVPILNPEMYD